MGDYDNLFDAALSRADGAIRGVMGATAQIISGAMAGATLIGVFDDPENIGYAGTGVRVEGSSPSFFVKTTEVRLVRRLDSLTINADVFWVDRVGPDDCGSCYLWLGRGTPPAAPRRRQGGMLCP